MRQRHNSDLFVKGKPRTHRSHNKHQGTAPTSPQITWSSPLRRTLGFHAASGRSLLPVFEGRSGMTFVLSVDEQ